MLDSIDTWQEFLPLALGISALSVLVVGLAIDYAEECLEKKARGATWHP